MEGFITMIRDISDVAHNVKHVTKHNAEIIASEIPGWTGTNSGTLLTPIANTTNVPAPYSGRFVREYDH